MADQQVQFSAPQKTCMSFELFSVPNMTPTVIYQCCWDFGPVTQAYRLVTSQQAACHKEKNSISSQGKFWCSTFLQLISPSNTLQLLQTIHTHFSLATRGCQRVTVGLCVSGLFLSIRIDLSKTQKDLHKLEKFYCYLYLRPKKKSVKVAL